MLASILCSCSDPIIGSVKLIDESSHDEVAAKLAIGSIDVAILPEPKATAAILAAKQAGYNYSIKLNLSEEWSKISETELTMGCLLVRNDFVNDHELSLVDFLDDYKKSIEYIGNSENHEKAAAMIVSAEILPKLPIAKSALNNLYGSIVYQDGDEMKKSIEGFYDAINLEKPDNAFYFSKSSTIKGDYADVIKIAVMNGPTGMGMAKLMDDYKDNESYEFVLYSDPTLAVADLTKGKVDMACLPTNTAATLANKGQPVTVASINCLGSLYVVAKEDVGIESISDLIDKEVYYGVPTSTTAPIFKYILSKNKIALSSDEE